MAKKTTKKKATKKKKGDNLAAKGAHKILSNREKQLKRQMKKALG